MGKNKPVLPTPWGCVTRIKEIINAPALCKFLNAGHTYRHTSCRQVLLWEELWNSAIFLSVLFLLPPDLITFFLGSLHMPPNQSFCLWSLFFMVYSPLDHQINLSKPTFSSLNPLLIMFSLCSEIFSCSLKCPCVSHWVVSNSLWLYRL